MSRNSGDFDYTMTSLLYASVFVFKTPRLHVYGKRCFCCEASEMFCE